MIHVASTVSIQGSGETIAFITTCSCGVTRESAELMSEHLDAMKFRSFADAVLSGRDVTILGRTVNLS